jgi:hypothetical protein
VTTRKLRQLKRAMGTFVKSRRWSKTSMYRISQLRTNSSSMNGVTSA